MSTAEVRNVDSGGADMLTVEVRNVDSCGADMSTTEVRNVDRGGADMSTAEVRNVDRGGAECRMKPRGNSGPTTTFEVALDHNTFPQLNYSLIGK